MCAVFGLLDFEGKLTPSERLMIFKALSKAAESRGTDATGVAYVQNHSIQIQKAPRPAHKMRWQIAPESRYLMGHTRMTTQGSEKKNYNNHPFWGKAGQLPFALAHNGVLFNDFELKKACKLPHTKIETDSYVAVQLIEQSGQLSNKSLKQMSEALDGSFTITVLDGNNDLYLVKGNNPLVLYLFPNLGIYLYASTAEILDNALNKLKLSQEPKVEIVVHRGDILKIDSYGKRTLSKFDDTKLCMRDYCRYYGLADWYWPTASKKEEESDYLEEVVSYGISRGVPERELRLLVDAGYDAFDLEELLFDPHLRQSCVQEILCGYGGC